MFAPLFPSGNSSLGFYFPLKILVFKIPLPLGISNDPPQEGVSVDIFWSHNINLWCYCQSGASCLAFVAFMDAKLNLYLFAFFLLVTKRGQ